MYWEHKRVRICRILSWNLAWHVILFISFILIAFYVAAFGNEGTGRRYTAAPDVATTLYDFRLANLEARMTAIEKVAAERTATVTTVVDHGRRLDKLETIGLTILLAAAGGFATTAVGILSVRKHVRRNGG